MNKTTSFSKISASKNHNLIATSHNLINYVNNSTQPTLQQPQSSQATQLEQTNLQDSFFIDSINENASSSNTNLIEELPDPAEYSTKKKTLKEKLSSRPQQFNKYKTWCSESNLTNLIATTNPANTASTTTTTNTGQQVEADHDCYDFYELDGDQLQFSDHAGLFDDLLNTSISAKNFNTSNIVYNDLEESNSSLSDSNNKKDNRKILLNNYDIYKATKKNYKLTFNKNMNNNNNNTNKNKTYDSLVSSALLQQSNNYDDMNDSNPNYNNDEDFYDEEESCDGIRDINLRTEIYNKMSEQDLMNYLNKNNPNFEESIMNWSMKLSNYQQQQQQQQMTNGALPNKNSSSNNNNNKRSQSRSPIPRSVSSSSHFYAHHQTTRDANREPLNTLLNNTNPTSFNINNNSNNYSNGKPNNQTKTSWGKLKHSKSSCSNISSSINNSNDENNNQTKFNGAPPPDDSSTSSPSLFKLFQHSKANSSYVEGMEEEEEEDEEDDEEEIPEEDEFVPNNQQMINRLSKQRDNESRKTSFSQIRERSYSSHAIIENRDSLNQDVYRIESSKQMSKKSVGIQHQPPQMPMFNNHSHHQLYNPPAPAPTIVCMVVDRNHKTTTKDIMAAAKAARQVVAARRSSSLFHNKSSLPDLTFLKDYSDDKNHSMVNNQTQSNNHNTSVTLPLRQEIENFHNSRTLSNQQQQQQQGTVMGSDLLKRKTLKSIKRYRQTKQNTEPCVLEAQLESLHHHQHPTLFNQYFNPKASANNEIIICDYVNEEDENKMSKTSLVKSSSLQQHQQQQQQNLKIRTISRVESHESYNSNKTELLKQPLKSCLKRKDSQQSAFNPHPSLDEKSNINSSSNKPTSNQVKSSLVLPVRNNFTTQEHHKSSQLATDMFVPLVGYLFTCDQESCTRYRYYNNLERNRRFKIYKQLTNTSLNEKKQHLLNNLNITNAEMDVMDDQDLLADDDDSITLKAKTANYFDNIKQPITSSKSDNDLRFKKSVTFLANVKQKQMSPDEEPSSSSIATTGTKVVKNDTKEPSKRAAPPLQYNTLINMLKSSASSMNKHFDNNNNTINDNRNKLETSKKESIGLSYRNNSPQLIKKSKKNNKNKTNSNSNTVNLNNMNPLFFNTSQIIDADSISLASLSESPPSEFKFSDQEEEEDVQSQRTIKNVNSSSNHYNTNNNNNNRRPLNISNKQFSEANHLNYNIDLASALFSNNDIHSENAKMFHQLNKTNQLNELRRKKNFHSVLLKDTKLNNLKEILGEIKQQQQKLTSCFTTKSPENSNSKYDTHQSTSSTSTSSGNSSATSSSTSSSSASSTSQTIATLNKPTATATTANSSNILVEFKETIDRLSQYLFEFLKHGLKPIPTDVILNSTNNPMNNSIQNTNFTNIAGAAVKSPPSSPVSVCRQQQVLESNTLTTTFSQYTQIWNLVEHTMNLNFINEDINQIFSLPKDAYLAMFQEINRYANSINHTYLIDSGGVNTSQLRRKHHFMVLLIGLKFKFQLFVVNLLSHRQLANWFEFLNREKNLLKIYYDIKPQTLISSISDNLFASTSSSASSSFNGLLDSKHMLTNNTITTLANISIFENEEYFSYFHKLLEQFNFMDFSLNLLKELSPVKQDQPAPIVNTGFTNKSTITANNTNLNTKPIAPLRKISTRQSSHSNSSKSTIPNSVSSIISNAPNLTSNLKHSNTTSINQPNNGSGGFNFKSISKKFNIKSWFTSSNSHLSQPPKNSFQSSQSGTGYQKSLTGKSLFPNNHPIKAYETSESSSKFNTLNQTQDKSSKKTHKNVVGGFNVLNNKRHNENAMKHSLSEPSINALIS